MSEQISPAGTSATSHCGERGGGGGSSYGLLSVFQSCDSGPTVGGRGRGVQTQTRAGITLPVTMTTQRR